MPQDNHPPIHENLVCHADIIQPYGEGQIGLTAVVLCSNLTVRKDRSASSEAVTTLNAGARFMVQNQVDGWADCFISDDVDGGCSGWVNADYIVVDPAWYRTNGSTPVYAWNDTRFTITAISRSRERPLMS